VIKEIEIEGFKSLEKVRLELGGLNLFIGANASGKSNFFDALLVLQGLGYGFTVDEVFNGKPKGAGTDFWEGIRGGAARAVFSRRGRKVESGGGDLVRFSLRIESEARADRIYSFELVPSKGRLIQESVWVDEQGQDHHVAAERHGSPPSRSSLLPGFSLNLQRVEPVPAVLRQYSQSKIVPRMGEHGENFAALVKSILSDDDLKAAYLSWLRQLTPVEIEEVKILKGALGEPLFAIKEGDEILPAPILSDGTLRFAALAAAFFQLEMPEILTIEEIENGIHPSRLRLLVELLKSQSRGSGPQVFATTHSPVVLAWLDEEDYRTTFLCRRDAETGASVITPLSEIPHLVELVRKQPIGELFTEGWLEGAF
jgi:energy-coupling factor transporter ATP-binding protein EcfA2